MFTCGTTSNKPVSCFINRTSIELSKLAHLKKTTLTFFVFKNSTYRLIDGVVILNNKMVPHKILAREFYAEIFFFRRQTDTRWNSLLHHCGMAHFHIYHIASNISSLYQSVCFISFSLSWSLYLMRIMCVRNSCWLVHTMAQYVMINTVLLTLLCHFVVVVFVI